MSTFSTIALALAISSAWVIYRLGQVGKRESYLPPGPPTVPLLGNLKVFPTSRIHFKLTEWAKEYGDVYSLKMGPKTAVVVSSAIAVREIIDKHSALASDRPPIHMAALITGGKNVVFSRYNDTWKKLRRAAHEILSPQSCNRHLPIQQAEATQLMHDILNRPEEFYNSIRRYSASVVLSVLYGKRAPQFSTHDVTSFYHVQHIWEKALEPGSHPPMDFIPILKRVPERFAPWKKLCKEIRALQRELYFGLLGEVEDRTARGEGNGCFMETACERAQEWSLDKEMLGYLGGVLLAAGSDTTSSVLQSLILALVAFPEVQRKAQEEIDRVIGFDRAPCLEDVSNMPYVQAVIMETHRFRPSTTLVTHATTADIMHNGYRIPAGSMLLVNNWGIFHDESVYEDEHIFNPDRYLKTKLGTRPEHVASYSEWREDLQFGSGRRACPGIHLARNSVAMNTVNLLWAFNFGKAKDASTGAEVEPDLWNYAKGFAVCPNPFECTISPRSPHHAEIIERQFAEATSAFLPFEHELSPEDRQFVAEQRAHQ